MTKQQTKLEEFLRESNLIEREDSEIAYEDAYKAWRFLENFDELTLDRILEVHKILMGRLNPEIAGKLRTCMVRVGFQIPPRPEEVKELLERWIEIYGDAKIEGNIRKAHIEFEKIHSFRDGNGRTGRIIMNWQRIKAGLPLLIIHVGAEQNEYYSWWTEYTLPSHLTSKK